MYYFFTLITDTIPYTTASPEDTNSCSVEHCCTTHSQDQHYSKTHPGQSGGENGVIQQSALQWYVIPCCEDLMSVLIFHNEF